MKYVCKICGYIYDEDVEGATFKDLPDSWTCPLCGAAKSDFEPEGGTKKNETLKPDKKEDIQDFDEDMKKLSAGQLAAIFSNLARGCEKQYNAKGQEGFGKLAKYFDSITPTAEESETADILALLSNDLDNGYNRLNEVGIQKEDRGALRAKVWGEKVSKILRTLIERYEKEGETFLENTEIWVCTVCGFVYIGEKAPTMCPVCKVPNWKFEKIIGR